jgi:hypothetical protein
VFQVREEDEYASQHDVELDGSLNGPRSNTTAGHSDEAGGNDDDAQSDDSHSQDNHEPEGSEYDDDDDDDDGSEEGDGKTKSLLSNTSEWATLLRNSSKTERIVPVRYALEMIPL